MNNATERRSACRQQVLNYQSKFSVPTVTSREILDVDASSWILVDVRTRSERNISMIRGAKTLTEFDSYIERGGLEENPARVGFYCTIGFRSGMMASQYMRKYPSSLQGRVYNVDGVIAFSQAVVDRSKDNASVREFLIDPVTGEPATSVHTFGKEWDHLDSIFYEPIYFSSLDRVAYTLQVGCAALSHYLQQFWYFVTSSFKVRGSGVSAIKHD